MIKIFLIICYVFYKAFALSCIVLAQGAIPSCTKKPCANTGDTICAETPEGTRKTFKTKCAMATFNCNQGTNYSYVMDGPCCAVRCADIYEPICAEDSNGVRRTFTSSCQLAGVVCNEGSGNYWNVFNLIIFYFLLFFEITDFEYVQDGPCCAVRCALTDDPICAVDSNGEKQTFGSQCELSGLICSHGIDFRYLMHGACPWKFI